MTKKAISNAFEGFKKSFQFKSTNTLIGNNEETTTIITDSNNNNEQNQLKRKYIELKDKVKKLKKIRFTETEQLFEEFKIKAEQRDSDARKLINRLKRELENSNTSNKVLTDTLNDNHGFNCEEIKKDIISKTHDDHNYQLAQLKSNYEEKIQLLENNNKQLQMEKEQLSLEFQKFKELKEFELIEKDKQLLFEKENAKKSTPIITSSTPKENIIGISTNEVNKIEELNELKQIIFELKSKVEKERQANSDKFKDIVNKASDRLLKIEEEKTELANKYSTLSIKYQEKSAGYKELFSKFEDMKHSIITDREEFAQLKNQEIQELQSIIIQKSVEFKEFEDSSKQTILELESEIEEINHSIKQSLSDHMEKKNHELEEMERKHTLEIEDYEDKLAKINDDSLKSIQNILAEFEQSKLTLNNLILENKDLNSCIDVYKLLTGTSIIALPNNKFEVVCENSKNNTKIHGFVTINENDIYYDPISVGDDTNTTETDINSSTIGDNNNDFLGERLEFAKDEGMAFIVKIIEAVLIGK